MMRKLRWSMVIVMVSLAILSCSQQGKRNEAQAAVETQGNGGEETMAESPTNDSGKEFAPDFTLNDIGGKPFKLSSLRGKYVMLDFWGSWCIWCVRGFPKMKEYYAKYNDKFEIVGIDCRDSQESWKETVNTQQLPWLHVYMPDDSPLMETYNIQGFPTKVIIAPDGTLVQTFIGESDDFYTTLDNLFQ
ncbi:MAG: TlpA family protein disulfide reductase [Prevotella sp.]|nr:TlpA family protein disulfide reductase [Prevotella sp.]